VRDYWGLSVGGNLNRYLGGELSGDLFERRLKVQGFGSVGEYAVTAVVPQIRVRYPLFDGKLTPYAVAGAGFAVGEFNDRKQGTFGHGVDADRTVPVGTLGGGIEYFLADGLAVGVEVKYLFAGDQTLRIDKVEYSHSIASLLTSFGVRLFYPERPTAPPIDPEGGRMRLYLGLRVGGAAVTNSHVSDRLTIEPEPPAIGPLNQYFGGALGLDITHHVGVELVLEGYETNIELAESGVCPSTRCIPSCPSSACAIRSTAGVSCRIWSRASAWPPRRRTIASPRAPTSSCGHASRGSPPRSGPGSSTS
jgi:hypothetical protein